jgi:hypothetical protein
LKQFIQKCYILLGFGEFITEAISSGEFVVNYAGKLLNAAEAEENKDKTYLCTSFSKKFQ